MALRTPDPLEFSFLQEPQQLGLERRRKLGYFVEEYGAAAGLFEASDLGFRSAGNSALLMTESARIRAGDPQALPR